MSPNEVRHRVENRTASWPQPAVDDIPTIRELTRLSLTLDPVALIAVETLILDEMEAHRYRTTHSPTTDAGEPTQPNGCRAASSSFARPTLMNT